MRILILLTIFTLSLFAKYELDEEFKGYFNQLNCSIILDKFYYINCYDYNLKGSKALAYEVKAENLKLEQIKKRPRFEEDFALAKKYRSRWEDYKNSSYSRGHIAPNASFSYSVASQKAVFLMSNITPQNFQINNKIWNDIEKRERKLALKFQKLDVLNLILYNENPKRIKNHIAIPSFYIKIFKTKNYKECYKVPNHNVDDENIVAYKISCEAF
ncbi:DNA/RNA non-specific endonuclease [Campylobacter helveticus]|uniref:DNA/RNA non-specific endonuclease n=1 Tax=Campylobacter helveticus TaxID=28898 RepID=A0AAX2UJ50_9BACT|nr:DNA/RNA non-specific endonuclease [Campylobacter helveticus]ARE81143.1 DNA/RNA endonuclease G [Campylobacter helveticus]MCR2039759.1 DNA/RNA non-specific endonuclease [Campylobacter helveticus]MCR2054791.1 DNA/RNA non-specific endonuclease [Campylobacter helveticus]MCR2055929.1 DNA/RNA non-specific endonuclease [Campylobacter helveticus]MCR2059537.1 DNA/RNA non-specific endonuclease [Campylobacter helveticus]